MEASASMMDLMLDFGANHTVCCKAVEQESTALLLKTLDHLESGVSANSPLSFLPLDQQVFLNTCRSLTCKKSFSCNTVHQQLLPFSSTCHSQILSSCQSLFYRLWTTLNCFHWWKELLLGTTVHLETVTPPYRHCFFAE